MSKKLQKINPNFTTVKEGIAIVNTLINTIVDLQKKLDEHTKQVQLLEDEIKRLKSKQGKPKIRVK